MADAIETYTDQNWEQRGPGLDQPVLVDFWAEWCEPCKTLVPDLEAVAAQFNGRLQVGKLNVEENDARPLQLQHHGPAHAPDLQGRQGLRAARGPASPRTTWSSSSSRTSPERVQGSVDLDEAVVPGRPGRLRHDGRSSRWRPDPPRSPRLDGRARGGPDLGLRRGPAAPVQAHPPAAGRPRRSTACSPCAGRPRPRATR